MKKALWKFGVYCGRGGSLSGLFMATEKDIESIIGETIHFGEVLGKHSDVSLEMKKEYFTLVTKNQKVIQELEKVLGRETLSGYNPFDYVYEEDEEEENDDEA